jgi:hypothetical protein
VALDVIGKEGVADASALEAFVVAKAEELLKGMAREDAREANGLGRLQAAEETKDEIEAVVYTAIMDNGVCETCEAQDGDEYGPDEMGQAPNPDCEGALYAGCRCAEVIIYQKDWAPLPVAEEAPEPTASEGAQSEAATIYETAKAVEGPITDDIRGAVSANDAEMFGLGFRVKDEESLARKIDSEAKDKGISVAKAAEGIRDSVRYTAIVPDDNFGGAFANVRAEMEAKGYAFDGIRNTLKDTDVAYRGVNTNMVSPSGQVFELQFHTKESMAVKEVNHELYKEARLDTTSVARADELKAEMIANANTIPSPKGIEDI